MTDMKRLEQLMLGRHPCIAVSTHEEPYVLSLIRECVLRSPYLLRMWSTNGGLRDGLLLDVPPIPETEHPAAALCYLFNQTGPGVHLMLDLAEHLGDARTRRLLHPRTRRSRCPSTAGELCARHP